MAEEPIMLSNDDVARLHASEAKAAATAPAATPGGTATDDAQARAEADALAREMDAKLKARLDRISQRSMDNVTRTLDDRALSAVSAGPSRAPTRSTLPAAPVDEPAGLPAAPAPRDDAEDDSEADGEPTAGVEAPRAEPIAACMYGTRGHLLHAPDGMSCTKVRQAGPARTTRPASAGTTSKTRADEEQVGCVYGSRGQLLYSSPGVECAPN